LSQDEELEKTSNSESFPSVLSNTKHLCNTGCFVFVSTYMSYNVKCAQKNRCLLCRQRLDWEWTEEG
jgi:hypothetical protein